MATSWTYESIQPSTDGSKTITKSLVVETSSQGLVALLAIREDGSGSRSRVLFHLDPDDADALAHGLRAAARRMRAQVMRDDEHPIIP